MAPQWFSQFPDPCAKGGTVTITVGAGAPFPFHANLAWMPSGGTGWTYEDAGNRSHTFQVPSDATVGVIAESAGKSLSLTLNVAP
jgi:hypothetical protein